MAKKLLVLCFFPAFTPPVSGGELRLLNMYSCLSQHFDVSLVTWTHSQDPADIVQHHQTFREYRVPKDRSFDAAYESCHRAGIKGELAGVTCSMVGRQGGTQYHKLVAKLSADADAIVHEFPYTVPYDLGLSTDRKPRIYNSHNLEGNMVRSLVQGDRRQEVLDSVDHLERRLVTHSRLVFATSTEELLKFRCLYRAPLSKLRLAPNGFKPTDFDFDRCEAQGKEAYGLFIGSQHPPNIEGVRFLTRTIAPRLPRQRFVVAGRVGHLINSAMPNVEMLGEVTAEEKKRLFQRAQFFVNPIFDGAGTSLKVVEAMAAGLPIVTTHAGARGLELRDEVDALLADDNDFDRAILRLIHDGDLRLRLSQAVRKVASARFSWPVIGRSVAGEINRVLALPSTAHASTRAQTLVVNDYAVQNAVSGGSKRIYSLLREIATRRDVVLLCLHDKSAVDVEELAPGLMEIRVPKAPEHRAFEAGVNRRSWISINDIAAALHCLENVVLTGLFRRLCDSSDIIVFSHPYMGPLLELVGKPRPALYEAHNVEAEMKADILRQHPDGDILSLFVAQLEAYLQNVVTAIICASDSDRKAFERHIPRVPAFVVGNGCALLPTALANAAITERSGRDLALGFRAVFIGSGHPPNVEAAKFLCTKVLPQFPNMELWIIGSVGAALDQFGHLAGLQRFNVVSDEKRHELLLQADIALNPVVGGGGSNLKLADYFAYGLPTVSTAKGVRGFDVKDAVHLLVRPPSRFVEGIREVIADPAGRSAFARAAQSFARAHLGWQRLGRRYEEVLRRVAVIEPICAAPRILVITYRYTEPSRGGAEEYLLQTLRRYVALYGASIDLVAPNVADIGNRFHFTSDFEVSHTKPEQLFAPFLQKVDLFPPEPLDQDLLRDQSAQLWQMWMTEGRLLGQRATQSLLATCLLGGWYEAEQHEDGFLRWSSECADIHVVRGVSVLRLKGWRASSAAIDVHVDGHKVAQVVASGDVAFEILLAPEASHQVRLSMEGHLGGKNDPRCLGFLLKQLEALEGEQGVWQTISLEFGFEVAWRQTDRVGWVNALRTNAEKRKEADDELFLAVRGPRSSALVNHVRAVAGQYDIALVQGVPFSLSVDVVQAVQDAGVPMVVLPHFHVEDAFYHWRQYYQVFGMADAVLSFSEWVSGNFFAKLALSAPVIPGGGVEPAEYATRILKAEQFRRFRDTDRPYFLILGRKTGSKGYRSVIQTHQQQLRLGEFDADLVLIGPDDDKQPINAENVTYYGALDRNLVIGALAGCVALINMSTSESFGIVLVEAWMAGRPVIANRQCLSFTELVDDGTDGVLVGTLRELADAMKMVITQPERAALMGSSGQKKAMARYTWSAVAQRLNQIITDLRTGVKGETREADQVPPLQPERNAAPSTGSSHLVSRRKPSSRRKASPAMIITEDTMRSS